MTDDPDPLAAERVFFAAFAASSRYTHVYVQQQGRWRLVAAQGTQIPPEA